MRETLLNDEQRRDDAHGAVELGPPAQTDQGGSPYQTAFDPSAGGASAGGSGGSPEPRIYGAGTPGDPYGGVGPQRLQDALRLLKGARQAQPSADWQLSGEQK